MGQQRTWDHIPKRNCMWDKNSKNIFFSFPRQKGKTRKETFLSVETHYTCQVTNQSSHGELSFHHNPHLRLRRSLCLSTFRVIRRGGTRLKNAALLTYCHCCELCAIKQKPGVLLEHQKNKKRNTTVKSCLCFSKFTHFKSQLQTVLITASGPQA